MPETARAWRHHAFGVELESDFQLPGLDVLNDVHQPLRLRLARPADPLEPAPGELIWDTNIDGRAYRMWKDDGYQMVHEGSATYRMSADLSTLWCEPVEPDRPGWLRFLLDTVLWTASFLRGFELLHAGAVAGSDGVVAVAGATGAGKTSLTAELVRRGAPLVCDDILALRASPFGVEACPGPPLMNLPGATAGLGTELARFEGERWVAVPAAGGACRPVAAICLLERRPDGPLELRRAETTAMHLLAHSVGFDRLLPERRRRRFELFADLARMPVYRLRAGSQDGPSRLADVVEPLLAGQQAACA